MSVDTYLEGKKTRGRYRRFHEGDVEIFVADSLSSWAERVTLQARRILFWHKLESVVDHEHKPT